MPSLQQTIFSILVAICIVGLVGIPLGDPKFINQAVALEAAFVFLTFLSLKKPRLVLLPCLVISSLVIIGNTVSPQHIEIMTTFDPMYNAIVLILGGYLLQFLLLLACSLSILRRRKFAHETKH